MVKETALSLIYFGQALAVTVANRPGVAKR
jgi:hypothetical protein